MNMAAKLADFARRPAFALPAINLAAGGLLVAIWLSGAIPANAQASACQETFSSLNKKLEGQVAALNALQKGKKKQIDPGAACPRLRSLSAVERELLAYMKKEQSWCGIPDELINQFTQRAANTSRIAGQACKAASMQQQMIRQQRQMQQQQAAGPPPDQRPRLPSGPL